MRWKKLPLAMYRRAPVVTTVVAAALLSSLVAVVGYGAGDDAPEAARGRAILDRVWFDRYPSSARDEIAVGIWLSGGVGAYQHGSSYRFSFDMFEFERSGERLDMRFLQDGEEARTRFTVAACDEAPPFDLCLTLRSSPRGPRRYYSFGDPDDLERNLPWAASWLRRARAAR